MKPCPSCGKHDFDHNWMACPLDLWPGVDGEWHRTLTSDSELREPKVGYWWTFCCEKDLEEITTEAQMAFIRLERVSGDGARVWPTKQEALKALAEDGYWKSEIVRNE